MGLCTDLAQKGERLIKIENLLFKMGGGGGGRLQSPYFLGSKEPTTHLQLLGDFLQIPFSEIGKIRSICLLAQDDSRQNIICRTCAKKQKEGVFGGGALHWETSQQAGERLGRCRKEKGICPWALILQTGTESTCVNMGMTYSF